MSKLSEIVNVSISRETAAIQQAGFGIPLIVGTSAKLAEVDSVVLTFDATLVTGNSIAWTFNGVAQTPIAWNTSHDLTVADWRTALLLKSEISTVVASDVGAVGYDNTITITGAADPARVLLSNMTVTGGASQPGITQVYTPHTRIQYYSAASEMLAAGGGPFAATDPEYLAALAVTGQDPSPSLFAVGSERSGDADQGAALSAIQVESDLWYAIIYCTRTKTEQQNIATWVSTQSKIYLTSTADATARAATTTDIIADFNSNSYDRAGAIWHSKSDASTNDDWPEAAWFGDVLPLTPGSVNWAYKTLTGVSADEYTATERLNVWNKNGNTYQSVNSVNVTQKGTMGSGEYIDTMRGVDWLQARIQEGIFGELVRSDKIPFTDKGIGIVTSVIREVLDAGIANGFLTENTDTDVWDGAKYYLSAPLASAVSANDKAARELKNISFKALLAGAVNYVEINGVVTV